MRVVLRQEFFHDGRGPELAKIHYGYEGRMLLAADYRNPDDSGTWHLLFLKPQVFMLTPEEVENYEASGVDWGATDKGAAVCLGRSPWLQSFSQRHLAKCEHYRFMFYDEFLDIICEGVEAKRGAYAVA